MTDKIVLPDDYYYDQTYPYPDYTLPMPNSSSLEKQTSIALSDEDPVDATMGERRYTLTMSGGKSSKRIGKRSSGAWKTSWNDTGEYRHLSPALVPDKKSIGSQASARGGSDVSHSDGISKRFRHTKTRGGNQRTKPKAFLSSNLVRDQETNDVTSSKTPIDIISSKSLNGITSSKLLNVITTSKSPNRVTTSSNPLNDITSSKSSKDITSTKPLQVSVAAQPPNTIISSNDITYEELQMSYQNSDHETGRGQYRVPNNARLSL